MLRNFEPSKLTNPQPNRSNRTSLVDRCRWRKRQSETDPYYWWTPKPRKQQTDQSNNFISSKKTKIQHNFSLMTLSVSWCLSHYISTKANTIKFPKAAAPVTALPFTPRHPPVRGLGVPPVGLGMLLVGGEGASAGACEPISRDCKIKRKKLNRTWTTKLTIVKVFFSGEWNLKSKNKLTGRWKDHLIRKQVKMLNFYPAHDFFQLKLIPIITRSILLVAKKNNQPI